MLEALLILMGFYAVPTVAMTIIMRYSDLATDATNNEYALFVFTPVLNILVVLGFLYYVCETTIMAAFNWVLARIPREKFDRVINKLRGR